MPHQRPAALKVLLIDHDEQHALALHDALALRTAKLDLHHVRSGQEAERFLYHEDEYQDAPRPSLIFMDLRMPDADAIGFLQRIKRVSSLRPIPVLVLTASQDEQDVYRAYHVHANAYLVKPDSSEGYAQLVDTIAEFWAGPVKLPLGSPPENSDASTRLGEIN